MRVHRRRDDDHEQQQQHRRCRADRDSGDGKSAALLIGPLDLAERGYAKPRTDDGNQDPDEAEKAQWDAK